MNFTVSLKNKPKHTIMTALFRLILLLVLFFTFSCSDKVVEKPFISPPFAHLNPEYIEYNLDVSKGDTIFIDSGSEIIVPANIWVNKNGEKIEGNINLKYREFSDALDIFLAGVSLNYDSAQVKNNFKTAGMFEIRAYKDSNEIFIDKNKFIDIKLASNIAGDEYNFYTLDEKNKNWTYKGTDKPVFNSKINKFKDSIKELTPKHPFPFTKDYFALDYFAILDVYFNVKPNGPLYKYKENKSLKRKSKKYGLNWSGIYGDWNQIYFNGRKYFAYELVWKNVSNKRIPNWVQTKKYMGENYLKECKPMGNNKYYMSVYDYSKKRYFKFFAEAVKPLKEVFKQMPDEWKNEYEITQKKIAETERKLAMQKQFLRTYKISTTGYHNWDVINEIKDKILVKSDFKFQNKELEFETLPLMYFTDNNQAYVKIPYADWDNIKLIPDSTAKFVAVLSDKEVGIFTSKEYNKINFEELRNKKDAVHTFAMKTKKIKNRNDFLKMMQN